MTARPVDLAPVGPVRLPDSGLGNGWEATAVMGLTLLILSFGLVTLYSASSVFALRQDLPDTYFVLNQAFGAVVGLALLVVCALAPYRWWAPMAWPLLVASILALLILVLVASSPPKSPRWPSSCGRQPSPSTRSSTSGHCDGAYSPSWPCGGSCWA